ncbi:DMT family transporter [Halioglobus maricola]|uniref:DMT family transporter n=1 Tax=Halioglobus maricola TaxID=2601894 RepID=A0A5P9NPU1_9GAMM|nr:DMT family transporter [Halioglobus maricola]
MAPWIAFTLLAALMQTVRTAGQKRMAGSLSPMAATTARYLFGLPFAVAYLLLFASDEPVSATRAALGSIRFIGYAALAGLAQILATYWLIRLLTLRNFAIGTVFSKTEVILTAVLGSIFFAASLPGAGWIAVLVGTAGVLMLAAPSNSLKLEPHSLTLGLLAGLGFALTALWLRAASISLQGSPVEAAAVTLVCTVALQSLVCVVYLAWAERQQLARLARELPLGLFIGVTSVLGSIGWYTAMTYQEAALVRALGQIELIFALLLGRFWFGERLSPREIAGLALVTACVVTLLLL